VSTRSVRERPEFWALAAVTGLVLVYGVLYPNLGLVAGSLAEGPGGPWRLYTEALGQSATRQAIWTSLVLSVATVAGCAVTGVPLALLLDRVDLPGRRAFAAVAVAPMLLPPLVGTIAFIFLYGESGIVTRAVVRALGLSEAPYRLSGFWAVLLFHVYTIYPYFFVFTNAALKRLDPSIEEAARSLGAGPAARLWRVVLPSLRGALGAAALLTFMTSMASFSAPYLFGGTMRVLTLQIFDAKINNDLGLATVQTVLLAALSLAALAAFVRAERAPAVAGTKGTAARRVRVASPLGRAVALATGVALSVVVLLPHATIVLISVARVGAWTTQVMPPEYTFENYTRLVTDSVYLEPILHSAVMAGVSSAAALVLGVASAYLFTRYRFRGRTLTILLLLVPWSLPGTVLAFQVVETYSNPSWMTAGASLAGSVALLPIIYFLRNLPLVLRAAQVNLAQLDPSLEAAARSLGASWLATMRRVVLPLIMPGAVSGALLAFSLGLGEFVASIVAYVHANRPISIQIDEAMRQGDLGAAAAYGTILIVAVAAALAGLGADAGGRPQL
jgi:iron(III) transport system permease protein